VALLFGNSCRGNHLGQRSCASAQIGRTYGRKRFDQSTAKHLARRGPSTYGKFTQLQLAPVGRAPLAVAARGPSGPGLTGGVANTGETPSSIAYNGRAADRRRRTANRGLES